MSNKSKGIWTAIVFALTPLLTFWLTQWMLGGYPWQYSFLIVLGNYVCIGLIYFLLCAITNSIVLCSCIMMSLGLVWAIANVFINDVRGIPILPWDFTALNTALAVAGNYRFKPTWLMAAGVVVTIGLCILIKKICLKGEIRLKKANCGFRLSALFLAIVCLFGVTSEKFLEQCQIEPDVWDQMTAYKTTGGVATFVQNLHFMDVEEPEDYTSEQAKDILGQAKDIQLISDRVDVVKPNIIAIMNESWADFEGFGHITLSESVMDYVYSLDGIFGYAYTSVFGAGTSASEFEFLTGNSMAFLPSGSIPYQQYITTPKDSMASLLGEQGYECVAFHPGEKTSWQRNLAYPKLGFNEFTSLEDMHVEVTDEHGYAGDDCDFNELIYLYEHRNQSKPFFMFNVTIQNHGSYTEENYKAEVQVADAPGVYPEAEQYLTLVNKTDESFKILVDYFSKCEEPTIIVMFGDHQPSVEPEFLDMAYGVDGDHMTMEQYMDKFKVPFMIWANYELPEVSIERTSLNFLGQYVLELAGVETNAYGNYLKNIMEDIPVLTFPGYFDTEGNAISHLETNLLTDKVNQYQKVQYDLLFGK